MSQMLLTGGSERPPVRIGHHSQAYLLAAAEGAVGALMALYYRGMTGEGQHVDVSIRDSAAEVTSIGINGLAMMKALRQQSLPNSDRVALVRRRPLRAVTSKRFVNAGNKPFGDCDTNQQRNDALVHGERIHGRIRSSPQPILLPLDHTIVQHYQ